MEVNQNTFLVAVSTNLMAAAAWIYKSDILGLVLQRNASDIDVAFQLRPTIPIVPQMNVVPTSPEPVDHVESSTVWEWTVAVLAVPLTYMVLLQLANMPWLTTQNPFMFLPVLVWKALTWLVSLVMTPTQADVEGSMPPPRPERSPTHVRFHVLGAASPTRSDPGSPSNDEVNTPTRTDAAASGVDSLVRNPPQPASPSRAGMLIGSRSQHMFTFDMIATPVNKSPTTKRVTELRGDRNVMTSQHPDRITPSTDTRSSVTSLSSDATSMAGEAAEVDLEGDATD